MQKNSSRPSRRWSRWLPGLILLVVLVAAAYVLLHHSSFHKGKTTTIYKPNVPTASQSTKGESATASENPPGPGSDSGSNTKGTGASTSLIAPSGDFVNTHHPTLTSTPSGNQMASVCNTTPDITCQITFTNTSTGAVIALDSQSTDSSGAAYWSWTLQQVGLTQGTWQVKATASESGQSKTSTDAVNLVVEQ